MENFESGSRKLPFKTTFIGMGDQFEKKFAVAASRHHHHDGCDGAAGFELILRQTVGLSKQSGSVKSKENAEQGKYAHTQWDTFAVRY